MNWLELLKDVSAAALTVRAQALPENDNGRLLWPLFFPRENVESVRLRDVLALDDRPTASRREWDAPERRIPLSAPQLRDIEMVPIGADDVIGEREMQELETQTRGNQATIVDVVGARVPQRADRLVMACYRQLEIDCFDVWTKGQITQVDPQTGRTYVLSYGIDSGRLQTAGTPWSAATNAYNEFIAWLKDAKQAIGPLEGVLAQSSVFETILADAPTNGNGVRLTGADLVNRIKDDAMIPRFAWFEHDGSVDVHVDGGTAKVRTDVFPDRYIVAVPRGGRVGKAAFAPVTRAGQLSREVPEAKIDRNGAAVYHFSENDGKSLKIVAQINAFPVPEDQQVFSINIGAA